MKFLLNSLAILLAVTKTASFAHAQIIDSDDEPASVEIIGKKAHQPSPFAHEADPETIIEQRAATSDTAQLLQSIPGVSAYGAGGISGFPAIHGMADDRVRIQVNGMSLMSACPNHMNPPLSYIAPTDVQSIQVFAGITPVSRGGDSIAGTILVNSPAPQFAAPDESWSQGQLGTFYRSNGEGFGGNWSAIYANEKLNLRYNGSFAKSNNTNAARDFKTAGLAADDRGFLAGDVIGSTAYKTENHEVGMTVRDGNQMVDFSATLQSVPYQLFPNQRMDMLGSRSQQFNLHYQSKYQWGNMDARVFQQSVNHHMQFGDNKQWHYGAALGMPMTSQGKITGASLQSELFSSDSDTIRIGAEIIQHRLNDEWPAATTTMSGMGPDNFQNINDGQRDRFNVFAEWDANWDARWFSQLGVRSEMVNMNAGNVHGYNTMPMYAADAAAFNAQPHQRTDHNWDLTALTQYRWSDDQSIQIAYAQKTRSPNLYERYTWSAALMAAVMNNFVGDGNGYVGNLNLKPEVAHTVSASWGWKNIFSVTPYYTYVGNFIDAQRCPLSFSTNCSAANLTAKNQFVNLQYVNQNAQLFGMDVSVNLNLGSNNSGDFTLNGILNYSRGKNLTTDDNLYNIMPLNTRWALVQSAGAWTHTAEWQLVAAKTKVSAVRNEVPTGGFGLLNLRTSYIWKQLRVDVGVNNVLNKFYNPPLGGAYVGQGTTMAANGVAWGVPVPGVGRSIYTALNWQF